MFASADDVAASGLAAIHEPSNGPSGAAFRGVHRYQWRRHRCAFLPSTVPRLQNQSAASMRFLLDKAVCQFAAGSAII
jgi:hypothetical protein